MIKTDLEKIALPDLKILYTQENEKLKQLLLDGVSWNELTVQRKLVITLGSVIDSKQAIKNKS